MIETCQLLTAPPISSKEDGWPQKNFHLELALNVAKSVREQKTVLHFNCYQDPAQTMDKQDTGELIAPLC